MAHSKSAKKRIRQNEKQKMANKTVRSTSKTAEKNVLEAVKDENLDRAKAQLTTALQKIDKSAKQNIIHFNNASRKKSRLAKMVNELEKKLGGGEKKETKE